MIFYRTKFPRCFLISRGRAFCRALNALILKCCYRCSVCLSRKLDKSKADSKPEAADKPEVKSEPPKAEKAEIIPADKTSVVACTKEQVKKHLKSLDDAVASFEKTFFKIGLELYWFYTTQSM